MAGRNQVLAHLVGRWDGCALTTAGEKWVYDKGGDQRGGTCNDE
jgi:hypothetical protein